MPATFIFGLILLAGGIGALIYRRAERRREVQLPRWVGFATAGILVLSVLLIFLSSFTPVSTQNIAVETTFGHVDGQLSDGPHMIAPWDNVTEIDGAIQTNNYGSSFTCSKGSGSECTQEPCIQLRVGDQQQACADVQIRWRVLLVAGGTLFRNYHQFSNIRDSLVASSLKEQLNQSFQGYNPITAMTSTSKEGSPSNPTIFQIGKQAQTNLTSSIGGEVHILGILVNKLSYAQTVEDRINSVQAQVAKTDIAQESIKTAQDQAAAASKVANLSTPALQAHCLNDLDVMAEAHDVPAGFTCFGGSGASGIIVNSGKG